MRTTITTRQTLTSLAVSALLAATTTSAHAATSKQQYCAANVPTGCEVLDINMGGSSSGTSTTTNNLNSILVTGSTTSTTVTGIITTVEACLNGQYVIVSGEVNIPTNKDFVGADMFINSVGLATNGSICSALTGP